KQSQCRNQNQNTAMRRNTVRSGGGDEGFSRTALGVHLTAQSTVRDPLPRTDMVSRPNGFHSLFLMGMDFDFFGHDQEPFSRFIREGVFVREATRCIT